MKIDRSLFLLLTGTIAAATTAVACEVKVEAGPPPQTAQGPQPPPPQAAAPPPPAAPPPAAKPSISKVPVIPFHFLPFGQPAPAAGAGGAPPPQPGACLDDGAATPDDCAKMQAADKSCAPFPFPTQKCAAYKQYFKPKVAAAAVSCMNGLSSKQVCDGSQSYTCGNGALNQACVDQSVAQLCGVAATSCKTTAQDCTAMLSGLNDAGRTAVAQCIAQGCAAGLYPCVEGLSSSSEGVSKPAKPK